MEPPDDKLALLMCGKDERTAEAAFTQLHFRYRAITLRYISWRINNLEDAADETQRVWVKIWFSRENFQAGEAFQPWMWTIVRRTVVDYLRRHYPGANDEKTMRAVVKALSEMGDNWVEHFVNEAVEILFTDAFKRNWQELPIEYREALIMKFGTGLLDEVIAARLNQPIARIRKRLRLAKERLQQMLGFAYVMKIDAAAASQSAMQAADKALSEMDENWLEKLADTTMHSRFAEDFRGAWDRLPPSSKKALELKYLWGFSDEEIAKCLKRPAEDVKGEMRLARDRLKERLGAVGIPIRK